MDMNKYELLKLHKYKMEPKRNDIVKRPIRLQS